MNEQRPEAEVIDLEERRIRKAFGGSGPPKAGNWLAGLESGARFLAKENGAPGSELDEFCVTTPPGAIGEAVLLAHNIKGTHGIFEWHDPKIFSQNYRLYCIIEVLKFNGSDQPIQPTSVASDEDAEKQSRIHEDEQ